MLNNLAEAMKALDGKTKSSFCGTCTPTKHRKGAIWLSGQQAHTAKRCKYSRYVSSAQPSTWRKQQRNDGYFKESMFTVTFGCVEKIV